MRTAVCQSVVHGSPARIIVRSRARAAILRDDHRCSTQRKNGTLVVRRSTCAVGVRRTPVLSW
jgi:hypothetical protein